MADEDYDDMDMGFSLFLSTLLSYSFTITDKLGFFPIQFVYWN